MTDTKLDLDAIEQAAKAATPGPWETDGNGYDMYVGQAPFGSGVTIADRVPSIRARGTGAGLSDDQQRANMRHIATASPDVVLALVARLREAEGLLRRADKFVVRFAVQDDSHVAGAGYPEPLHREVTTHLARGGGR